MNPDHGHFICRGCKRYHCDVEEVPTLCWLCAASSWMYVPPYEAIKTLDVMAQIHIYFYLRVYLLAMPMGEVYREIAAFE